MPWLQAERLSVGQVQELHRQGVEVGAHSVNHPNLALAGAEAQGIEMRQGAATLESWVQQPIAGFAYPGGHCNESAREQARSAGFAYALSTLAGVNHADSLKPWELLRIGMPDAELPDFRRSVGGAMLRNMHGAHLRF